MTEFKVKSENIEESADYVDKTGQSAVCTGDEGCDVIVKQVCLSTLINKIKNV